MKRKKILKKKAVFGVGVFMIFLLCSTSIGYPALNEPAGSETLKNKNKMTTAAVFSHNPLIADENESCESSANKPGIGTASFSDQLLADAGGPYDGLVGEAIEFFGSATGGIPHYTWFWDFDDGTNSTEQNPIHVYTAADVYFVTLTVTDSEDKTDTDLTTATIRWPEYDLGIVIKLSKPIFKSSEPLVFIITVSSGHGDPCDYYYFTVKIVEIGTELNITLPQNDDDHSIDPESGRKHYVPCYPCLTPGLYKATATIFSDNDTNPNNNNDSLRFLVTRWFVVRSNQAWAICIRPTLSSFFFNVALRV